MQVSNKCRLAVSAMIDLALRESTGPVPLAAIAVRLRMSLSYLEQLFARLRTAGLVQSTRGPGGGYTLGRGSASISVAAIMGAVEASRSGAGEGDGRASLGSDLALRLDAVMQTHMASITLADLAGSQREAEAVANVARPRLRAAPAPGPRARPVAASVPNSVFELGAAMAMSPSRAGGRGS